MIYFIGNSGLIESNIYKQSTVEKCLEYFKNHESIEVDTETSGKDSRSKIILSLQIGDSDNQFVIDCRTTDILLFKDLLESKLCLLQNAKFDYKFFKAAGIILNRIYDTMLAECLIYCGYEKWGYGLAALNERYLGLKMDKSTRGEFFKVGSEPFTAKQIQYAAGDVGCLHKIREQQLVLIRKYNLEYCLELENKVLKALGDIEYNGMYLNASKWLGNTEETEIELEKVSKQLDDIVLTEPKLKNLVPKFVQQDLFGGGVRKVNINYGSPIQIKRILKLLGFDIDSSNDLLLEKIKDEHIFIKTLQEYRKLAKIISTYGQSFLNYINKTTGRVHTSFWQILTTGRVSSGSPDDNAPNLQNIPKDNKFRNCFEAREGFLWVSIDYSAQELCLMAEGSGEEGFIDILTKGEDLHCYVGSMMTGKTITKADKKERDAAKSLNFGKPYGMGPQKLANTLKISIEEAELLFKQYGSALPKLNKWLDDQGNFALKHKYSTTFSPSFRRRWYPELAVAAKLRKIVQKGDKDTWKKILQAEGSAFRNGMNQPIQGEHCPVKIL